MGRARWIAIVAGASVCFAAPVAHAGPNPLRFGPTEWPKGYAYGGSVATGDVTGDGRVDIVAGQGEPIPNDYNVVLFAQDADGSFAAPLRYDLDARYAATAQVGVGDLDSDGFADVAAASPNGIHVFYGSTDGLEGPLRVANTDWARGIELADMDGDGDLDLVSNRNGPGLLLVRNDRVAFSAATIGAESNYEIELGDVTGDGRVDVVGQQSRTTRVYRQLADGTFAPPTEHTTLDSAESIAIADLNDDGLNDVARTHDGRVDVLYQLAAGGLNEPARIRSYGYAGTLEAGDLDGDGRDDLVTSHRTRYLLGVYLQKPDGTLGSEDPYEFRYALYGPQVIAVADLDRDNLLDLVTAGPYLVRQLPRIRPPAPGEYRIVESTGAVMIPGDTDVGAHCDNCVVRIDFPFPVPLYERWYAQAWVDPHGALFFDHPTTTIHRHCVPWYDREDALFPAWSKYHVGAPYGVYTAVTGSAPQRRFVIEWRGYASMGLDDGFVNFEVIFHEDSAVISVVYGEMVADPGNVIAGIQRDRGSATSYACYDSNFVEGTRVDYVPTFVPSRQDLSPPETTLESGPSGSTAATAASFAFKATEAGAGFECSVDSESYAGCASPKRVQELTPGHHTFEVRAIDAGGNRDPTPAQRTWNVTTVPEDPVVLAAGDIAGCDWTGDESTAAIIDGYPDATVAALGDTVYDNGTSTEFANCYEPSWGQHKARTKPAVGNHEYGTTGAAGYFDYFGAAAGPNGKGWYSYDVGNWHVVVLNSNCTIVDCSPSSEQLAWLRADLAASAADCTMAYWHHPLFTSGFHADDPELQLVRPFWQALYEHGAELILVGDDHDYERFAPQTPTGVGDAAYGIRQIVVGTGGAPLRGFGAVRANSEVRESTTHGVLKLVLRSTGYDWQFLPVSGTFSDTGSGACHGAPDLAPPSPNPTISSSHGSGWSNDNTAVVTWSGESDSGSGVDGFSYEWSQSATTIPDTVKDVEETVHSATSDPPLPDGESWFHLRTKDNAGNWSNAVHYGPFRIDTRKPTTSDNAPAGWRNAAVTVTLSPADERSGVATTQYRVNSGSLQTGTQVQLTSDGTHIVEYRSTDHAGNVETFRTATVRIDTTKPTTTDDAPAGWRRTAVTVNLSATDTGSGVASTQYRVNGGAFTTGTQVALTSDGVHNIEYRSTDGAGNVETLRAVTVQIDRTAPTNPSLSSPSHTPGDWSNNPRVEISWDGADDATSEVDGYSYEWSQNASTDPDLVKDTFSPTSDRADGEWWFHLRTVDVAGNWSATARLGPFRIDTTAPTNPTISSPTHTVDTWSNVSTVVVEWADAGHSYSYEWSQSQSTIPDSVLEPATTRVASEREDGSWWFHLRARDDTGSWSPTSHVGPFLIDTTAPETHAVATELGFEFFASEPATFACSLDGGTHVGCASPVRYDGLGPGEHVFRVFARDRAGNEDSTPAELRWTIQPPPAPQPPPPPQPQPQPPPQRPKAIKRCVVPRLAGSTLKRAKALLGRRGCRLGRVTYAYSRLRRGLVFSQRPRAGRRLKFGARVSVAVSRGPLPRRL